jgi:hypothetical protein
MNKYAKQFNEMIVMAEKEGKSKKKGGSMAAIFKLIQDLAQFEENIQEAVNAQEMAENKSQIESFMVEIDKMYEKLFEIGKQAIQAMRAERNQPEIAEPEEGIVDAQPVPETTPEPMSSGTSSFSADDLRKQLELNSPAPVGLTVPKAPSIL